VNTWKKFVFVENFTYILHEIILFFLFYIYKYVYIICVRKVEISTVFRNNFTESLLWLFIWLFI